LEGASVGKIAALLAGPLLLIAFAFAAGGSLGGMYVLFFGGIAALIFIPVFAGAAALFPSKSLLSLLLVANLIPLAFWAYNCAGQTCPNFSLEVAAVWHAAASFCAFVYWAVR
jgi:hypothetical protein